LFLLLLPLEEGGGVKILDPLNNFKGELFGVVTFDGVEFDLFVGVDNIRDDDDGALLLIGDQGPRWLMMESSSSSAFSFSSFFLDFVRVFSSDS
jgi:hypothetical protein